MLAPYTRNGGMIGVTLDFTDQDRYTTGGGVADVEFVGATSTVASSTLSLPGSLQQDDMVLLVAASDVGMQPMTPSGYTAIYDERPSSTGALACYKFMGATPDTQITGLSNSDNRNPHIAMVFRGVDTTTPFDVAFTEISTAGSGMPNPPSITTATDGCMIVAVGHLDDDNITATAPSGFTLAGSQNSGGSSGATVMAAYALQATAGSIDPGAFGGSGSDENEARTIALKPGSSVTYGNKKNSGVWDLPAVYDSKTSAGGGYTLGLTDSLLTVSGTNDAWTQQTVDISAYAGATVKLAFRYINTGADFTSDIQIDDINLDGTTYSFENQTHSFETSNGSNYDGIDYSSVTFQSMAVEENNDGVFQVDSGGTPSNSTGRTDAADGSYYVYFESSSPANAQDFTGWFRSPSVTLSGSPTLTFYEARNGAAIGQLDVYLEVIS